MIIGIDGNEANVRSRVGVNTYAYELIKNLKKLQDRGENNNKLIVYLKNSPLPDMPEETTNFKYKIISGGGMWVLTKLMPRLVLNKESLDVFLSPSHYLPPISSVPSVCSIMDLGYLDFSGQFTKKVFWQLSVWSAISIFVSKAVIAISNSTKKNIVRHYPFAGDKIYVTHLAYDSEKFNNCFSEKDVRRVLKKYSIVDDYILYLGTLKPSKNIVGLLEAFSFISNKFPNVSLVIAGKKGWLYESIYKKVEDLGLKKRVLFTDFIDEEDKPEIIKGAKVFALPSFWEGFGLDILNAMASGTPVVASNVGSIPEVIGDAGILIDPNSINSIADGLSSVLSLSKLEYNSIVQKGLFQVKKFSWEKTARQTLEVLEKVSK